MLKQLQKKYLGSCIPVINIHQPITTQCTEKVAKRLAKLSKFKISTASALAVSINSPGGLPVQSEIICNKIRQFSYKHNLTIHTFAKDLAASGGYFILCCGNHVVADKTSIVGNIGVIFQKAQLDGLLKITSLQHKSLSSSKQSLRNMLNVFHKIQPDERQLIKKICGWTHEKFINHVKKYRGDKLKVDDKIFSGEIYTGIQAKQLGLVDDVGSMVQMLEKLYPGSKLDVEESKNWKNAILKAL